MFKHINIRKIPLFENERSFPLKTRKIRILA